MYSVINTEIKSFSPYVLEEQKLFNKVGDPHRSWSRSRRQRSDVQSVLKQTKTHLLNIALAKRIQEKQLHHRRVDSNLLNQQLATPVTSNTEALERVAYRRGGAKKNCDVFISGTWRRTNEASRSLESRDWFVRRFTLYIQSAPPQKKACVFNMKNI